MNSLLPLSLLIGVAACGSDLMLMLTEFAVDVIKFADDMLPESDLLLILIGFFGLLMKFVVEGRTC